MLALFFLVWVIFNGRLTLEIAVFGIAVSIAVFAFACKYMDYSLQREKRLYRKLPQYARYVLVLIREIVSANLVVCRLILTRKETVEPVLVRIHTDLKTETAKVILANSITLTPGTVTVDEKDGEFLVLCLDKASAEGIPDWSLVRILKKLEGEAWN